MGENSNNSVSRKKIQLLWDSFINAERGSYERGVWLDGFSAEFLLQLNDGKIIADILPNCSGASVSTSIACELLSDVHQICIETANDDDLSKLRRRLLDGRGWGCLAILQFLGTQDITCAKELVTLLISLYSVSIPENEDEEDESNPYLPERRLQSADLAEYINQLKLPPQKKRTSSHTSVAESCIPSKSRKVSNASASRRALRGSSAEQVGKEASSESEVPNASGAATRSPNIRLNLDPMDFEYFQSNVRSEGDVRRDSPSYVPGDDERARPRRANAEDLFDGRINDIFKQKLTRYEFKSLVLEILHNLTVNEMPVASQNNTHPESVSSRSLTFALEALCTLQLCTPPCLGSYQKKQNACLKSALIRLLLASLKKVLVLPEIMLVASQGGIILLMKKVLHDVIRKCDIYNSRVPVVSAEDLELIFTLLYSSIIMLHSMLLQTSAEKVSLFLTLFHQFSESQSGRLLDQTIHVLLTTDTGCQAVNVQRAKRVLISVSRLITALKKMRAKLVHARTCKRSRHKHCPQLTVLHHHDLEFGAVYTQSIFHNGCCVSTLFMSLLKCLCLDDLVLCAMQVMLSCGTCCCFPSAFFIETLLDVVKENVPKKRNAALVLLERTFYRQMGVLQPAVPAKVDDSAEPPPATPCAICANKSVMFINSVDPEGGDVEVASDQQRTCLDTFREMLLSGDPGLVHSVSSHLLRVAPRCCENVRKEMIFNVFYPVFLTGRDRYSEEKSEANKFVVVTCLSAFTNLLVTAKFMEQFISMSALSLVEDLMYEPDLIRPCCAIIEIAIIVQVFNWDVSAIKDAVLRENEISMSNLDMLLKHVNNSTKLLLDNVLELERMEQEQEQEQEEEEEEEVNDAEKNVDSKRVCSTNPMIEQYIGKYFSDFSDPLTYAVNGPSMSAEKWDEFRCYLERSTVLWRTCANIAIYSPQLRKYFSRHPISQQSYDLLCITLDIIGNHTNIAGTKCAEVSEKLISANQDTIKLFESLLTLNIIAPTLDANAGTLTTINTLLSSLEGRLLKTLKSGNMSACHLCDVLLRASTLLPSQKTVIPHHKMPKLSDGFMRDGSASESASTLNYADFEEALSSPDSSTDVTADEGYEADIDIPDPRLVEEALGASNRPGSNGLTRRLSTVDSKRDLIITYPGLCSVIVQLLSHYLFSGSTSDTEAEFGSDEMNAKVPDVVYCLQRLAAFCQDIEENCVTLTGQNFILNLMQVFHPFLISTNTEYSGLQNAVLSVVSHIGQRIIEPHELSQILTFFIREKPPLEPLLSCLNRIVSNVRTRPQFILRFPTNCVQSEMVVSATLDPAEKMAQALRNCHIKEGIQSSWSRSSVILPLNQELGWSMWASGLALSLWLCVNKPVVSAERWKLAKQAEPKPAEVEPESNMSSDPTGQRKSPQKGEAEKNPENPDSATESSNSTTENPNPPSELGLHLVSVGYDMLTLEIWTSTISDSLILCLNQLDGTSQKVLAEKKIDMNLMSGVWHHLAINVRDNVQKKRVSIMVTLIFDGCHEVPVELSFTGLLVRKARSTCVLVGHNGPTEAGSWQLGNLLMFRTPAFTKEKATCLMAYGTDHCYLTETEVGNAQPSVASVFNKGPLSANINWENILNNQKSMLRELQESLLLVYSARSPQTVCVYPQVVSATAAGVVGSLLTSQFGFRVVTSDGRSSQQLPMCLSPAVSAIPQLLHRWTFPLAANAIGGISTFLFLFARVVELEASEEMQAQALLLLLKMVNSNAEFYSQFVSQEQEHLLALVLTSTRCKLGLHILKVIFDTCCDRPGLLVHHAGSSQFQVSSQSRALLVNPSLVAGTILSCWRKWEQTPHCFSTLLQLLLVLLRDDHPKREFNLAQMNRGGTLDSLLRFCKERFLFEDSIASLDSRVCELIVELIHSLMSAPPRIEQIESIMKFLILAHPANMTYVTHLWSSFYFVIAIRPSTTVNQPHYISGVKTKVASQSLSDKAEKMKRNRSFLAGTQTKLEKVKSDCSLPVDPYKLNKALTNLQIKQQNNKEEVGPTYSADDPCSSWMGHLPTEPCDSGIAGGFRDNSDLEAHPQRQLDEEEEIVMVVGDQEGVKILAKEEFEEFTKIVEQELSCSSASGIQEEEKGDKKKKMVDEEEVNGKEKSLTPDADKKCSPNIAVEKDGGAKSAENKPPPVADGRVPGVRLDSVSAADVVTEGLLRLLHDIILVLPDSDAQSVLENIIKVEALLVMANHPNPKIRVAVIKILSAYLQRATDNELNRFLRMKGFHLLANQLFSYPITKELVISVVSLVTGRHWLPLEEQMVGAEEAVPVSPLQIAALPSLLALVPRAIDDLCLMDKIITFLERYFNKVPQAFRALIDAGILEVLLKTLLAVAHVPPATQNAKVSESMQGAILNDIHSFLIAVITQTTQIPGSYHLQVMNDLILLLNFMEKQERHDCGDKARCVYVLRAAHCTLLETALEIVQNKISLQLPLTARIRSSATAFFNNVFYPNYEDYLVDSARHMSKRNSNASLGSGSTGTGNLVTAYPGALPDKNRLPQSDLNDRFKIILTKSVDFIINNVPIEGTYSNLSTLELNFIKRLFSSLLASVSSIVNRKTEPKTAWSNAMWAARETIRSQAAKLLVWMLAPAHLNKVRMSTVNAIRNEPRAQEIIMYILENNQSGEDFLLFVWDLLHGGQSAALEDSDRSDCVNLSKRLHSWGLKPESQLNGHWEDYVTLAWEKDLLEQKIWWKTQESNAFRCLTKMESIVKTVSDCALSVMKTVTDDQNNERKQLMDWMRSELSEHVHTQILWKTVVRQLTHERAVWHFPKSYPRSWQLDSTEGPARIRTRLQRCHLPVDKKFLKPMFREKTDSADAEQPLSYLFDSEGRPISSMSAFLIEKLHTDQKIQHMATARVITPALEVPGELLIGETCVYFIPSCDKAASEELNAGTLDISAQAWQFEEIKEIHTRRFQLKERALEIFLLNGKTFLLAFESSAERDDFQSELNRCDLPNRIPSDNLTDAVQLWREGQLTNWEYLTTLNKMAGRTYNDLMQYPIMPFVLSNYISEELNLTNPDNYRNLEKPMAVQNKANELHYVNTYNYLDQEMPVGSGSTYTGPYHYGSHYSNSGTVLHFLVRLPPFTSMFLQYQDENFDLPDRTFHCLETTWRLSSRESTTDVKELLPEFFFLPEFFTNIEGFDFGSRQNGERVDDVRLPEWASGDPRRFVLIHRQALESDYVRENLPHWIDLVFGYKQTGKAAVDAVNVFHPATYCGFEVENIVDPLVRSAWETMVRTYGQTPRQLFKQAHPMVVQSLASKPEPPLVQGVKGLQWGSYVGSPTEPLPTAVLHQHHRTPVANLVPLLTNDVFGLAPQTSLLLAYSKEKTLSLVTPGGMCIHGAALVSWGHPEGVLRVKGKKEQPPHPMIRPPASSWDMITQCNSVPDCGQLWIGYSSGRILVYRYRFIVGKNSVEFSRHPEVLVGHSSSVLSLALSHNFSVAVSGSQDGSAIIWDMNRISYIRSLPDISMPVALACVSSTLGDIVTVGHDTQSSVSTLRLHSINATFLGSITTQKQITAVCFSTAPEGISINAVATGMSDGTIKLWNSWDLSPVCEITSPNLTQPIISLTYSHDSQHLYASAGGGGGYVVVWQSGSAKVQGSKTPKCLNLAHLV